MTTALIYENTGEIVGIRSGNYRSVVIDADKSGKSYILSDADASFDSHYVRVSTQEVVAYPDKPSDNHVFNYETEAWQFDVELGRQRKWRDMKAARDQQEFGQFVYNASTFECDAQSQSRIQAAAQSAIIDSAFSTTWTLADNTTQTLNATQTKDLAKALADHVKQCHDRGRIVRAEIDAATTEAQLEEIVW